MKRKLFKSHCLLLMCVFLSTSAYSHDTTHVHPLITHEIAKLIKDKDTQTGGEKAYAELYALNPVPIAGIPSIDQFLYWGIDFDQSTSLVRDQSYLLSDSPALENYSRYNNVIDGVVQADAPSTKVMHHFYQAVKGTGLTMPFPLSSKNGEPSSRHAMVFFNEAVDWYSKYDEESKHTAFFVFGQALHYVEDLYIPAHVHNDAENVLFAPILRCGQLKNTHVAGSTLRFLNFPRLVLNQTDSFSEVLI